MSDLVRVPAVGDMDDETLIKHMEHRHDEHIAMKFPNEPDRIKQGLPRRLRAGVTWRLFHDKLHELYDGRVVAGAPFYDHEHKAPQ